jgi:protein SCO1/2
VRLAALALMLLTLTAFAHGPAVDFDPHPGARLDARLGFREARLGDYLGALPVVLVLGYNHCANLCGTTLQGVSLALRDTGLAPERDYTALFVSIDPRDEKAPPERRNGWHFLTGAAAASALARAVGFRYYYDADSGEFAHPAGFVLLTPQGEVARYFMGVRFDAAQLRQAIGAAAAGKTESSFERLLLVCFHDPVSGKYNAVVLTAVRIAMALFLLAVGWFAWRKLR